MTFVQLAFAPSPARADEPPQKQPETEACFAAAERAQPLMRQRKFREARTDLETCARDLCPRVARTDCRSWLAEVAEQQPSIVIAAHEVRGVETHDVHGVRAIVDGAIVIERADASSFAIDPGSHRLKLERVGAPPVEQDVEVREGEKDRVVVVTWRAVEGALPPVPVPSRPVPPSVYVMGGLGAVALGVGTYLEVTGLSMRSQLDPCQPTRTCRQDFVDTARSYVRAGGITLGAGALFVVGAALLYFTRPTVEPSALDDVGWMIGPAPGGFLAGVRGRL
jgi:hypothetical protein